jgi:protein phosphatase
VSGAATDVGCVRHENEDSYLVVPERGVFAVADGMGGHDCGALASATIVATLQSIDEATTMDGLVTRCMELLSRANRQLVETADRGGGELIGATLAILLAHESSYACVWSGDARIYLVRRGEIRQISRDHTEVAELVAVGILSAEEAWTWPRRNVVTRAIGAQRELDVEIETGALEPGDIFVVCSDGLTAHVRDREILDAVGETPQRACDRLVALTRERGATDNVTVVVTRFVPSR